MSSGSKHEPVAGEALSALVDGEVDAMLVQRVCAAWRDDAQLRSNWHAYQLLGDVLRSEDLASAAARDAAFLQRLRTRLAQEPVVLAPQPLLAPAHSGAEPARMDRMRRRRTWIASTAVAAGFVAVAGVVIVLRGAEPASPATQIAVRETPSASTPMVAVVTPPPAPATVEPGAETQPQPISGQMVRDARLDRYLAAHKQFAGSSALGVPSSFLRSATVDAANR